MWKKVYSARKGLIWYQYNQSINQVGNLSKRILLYEEVLVTF